MIKRHGWINIYKEEGISSNHVLSRIKRILNIKKVGHLGTLDPAASGVLPVAIGEATKVISFIADHRKSYRFTVNFGYLTDSYDDEGEVLEKNDFVPELNDIKEVIKLFVGKISQKPPVYSAIKIGGKRSYQLARDGVSVDIPARIVDITDIKFISLQDNKLILETNCSKGTYVRSLGVDIAKKLGALATVTDIVRLRSGKFAIEDAIRLEILEKMMHNPIDFCLIKNITWVLDDIPVYCVDEDEVRKIRLGQGVKVFCSNDNNCSVITDGSDPVAVGRVVNGMLLPKKVFNII